MKQFVIVLVLIDNNGLTKGGWELRFIVSFLFIAGTIIVWQVFFNAL